MPSDHVLVDKLLAKSYVKVTNRRRYRLLWEYSLKVGFRAFIFLFLWFYEV